MNENIVGFNVIGISIRTSNENGQSANEIPILWERFFKEAILQKIPNKISTEVLCVYTDYESDHTKPYTTILGCKVSSLIIVPEGMVTAEVHGGKYIKFNPSGKLSDGIVFKEWTKIWSLDLNRKFSADFEVYKNLTQIPDDPQVEIFVALN